MHPNRSVHWRFRNQPGQILLLHSLVSSAFPAHFLPPCAGGGSVQVRERLFCPMPQVLEQADQSIHLLHWPSTAIWKSNWLRRLCIENYFWYTGCIKVRKIWLTSSIDEYLNNLLGQACTLQRCDCFCVPRQSWPPLAGGGLLHVLILFWTPPPQDSVQKSHSSQAPQWPSTVSKKIRCLNLNFLHNILKHIQ